MIGALRDHPRRADVAGALIEIDQRNVDAARAAIAASGLAGIDARCADASVTDSYLGLVPVDLVLLCGVLGNITLADIENTIAALPQLCARGATVIWTRHRGPPDQTPAIRGLLHDASLESIAFEQTDAFAVGADRLVVSPRPLVAGRRLFRFVGYDRLAE